MRLLYLYVKFYNTQGDPALYRGFSFWSINFSAQHYFSFTPETGQLSKSECGQLSLPQDFWGERIYNVTAFVSNNGGGKSTIMQYLILLLADLAQNLPVPKCVTEDWVVVFEMNDKTIALQNQSVLSKTPCQPVHADKGITCLCCRKENIAMLNRIHQHLQQTKLIYLSNVLSKADTVFQSERLVGSMGHTKSFIFDASTYALMHQACKECKAGDDILQIFFCTNRSECSVFSPRLNRNRC